MIRIDLNKSLRKLQDAEPLTLEQRAEAMGESAEYARNVQNLIDEGATIQDLASRRIGTVSGLSQLFPDAEMGVAPQLRSSSSSSNSGGGATSEIETKAAEFGMTPEKYVRYYNRGARMINEGKSIDDLVNMRYGTRGSLTRMFPTAPTETVKVQETPEESSNLDNLSQEAEPTFKEQFGFDPSMLRLSSGPKVGSKEGDLQYQQRQRHQEMMKNDPAYALFGTNVDVDGNPIDINYVYEEVLDESPGGFTSIQYKKTDELRESDSSDWIKGMKRGGPPSKIEPIILPSAEDMFAPITLESDNTFTVANNINNFNVFDEPYSGQHYLHGDDFTETSYLLDEDVDESSTEYTPLKLNLNVNDIENAGVTENLFGTASAPQRAHDELEYIVRPFAESLAFNKERIMSTLERRGTPIGTYEYDAIAPLVFGVFGAESNLGDTKTATENAIYTVNKLVRGGRSADPEAEMQLYRELDMDPYSRSVGWTQLNWNANLTDDEEELLAELGITSPTDLNDPELSALATMALFASRKARDKSKTQDDLLRTWNAGQAYRDKVYSYTGFLTPYSERPGTSRYYTPGVEDIGAYTAPPLSSTGIKNTVVDFLESLVYKEGGEVPGEDDNEVKVLSVLSAAPSSPAPPKQSYDDAADTYTPENYTYAPYRDNLLEFLKDYDSEVDFIDASNERFPGAKDAFYDSEVFMQEWMNSPQYEKLLLESTAGKPGVMKYGREDNLASAKGKQFIVGDIGDMAAGTIGALSYNYSPATIYDYHNFSDTPWIKSTAVHELSHATDRPYGEFERLIPEGDIEFATNLLLPRDEVSDNFEKYRLYTGSESGLSEEAYQYYADATELRARGNEARAALADGS